MAVPFPAAVTSPSLVTLATDASLLAQVTVNPRHGLAVLVTHGCGQTDSFT